MIHRSFRYRLYPTSAEADCLARFAGVTRFVYNLALEQRRDFWRQYRTATGRSLSLVSQSREVTELRAEVDWIGAVPATALNQALRDVEKAFANFFAGRARFPSPRRKGINDSFRCNMHDAGYRRVNGRWSELRVPRLGWIKMRHTQDLRGTCQSVTVSNIAGQWFASFACVIEHEAPANDLPAVGIDRGIAHTVALSTGEMLSTPDLSHLERRKRRAQRVLARRKRGSARYRKQRARVTRIAAKIARCRADWRHKTTTAIADRFGTVALEALQTANMTVAGRGKRGLNRSILAQGWRNFETALAYKLEERGGALIKVNPAFTSQECSACGTIDKASRESQSSFACRHCGFAGHADTNAAINILRRGTALVEGSAYAPDEARTMHRALAA